MLMTTYKNNKKVLLNTKGFSLNNVLWLKTTEVFDMMLTIYSDNYAVSFFKLRNLQI